MEPSLLLTGAWLLLKPLLEKAGEKAAETIGEKMAEKTVEKSFWKKVKGLFIVEDEKQVVEAIENKPIANSQEIAMIEKKVQSELTTNPQFIEEIKGSLNINSFNEGIVTEKFNSIKRLQDEIKTLEVQMERAGIASAGDYMNRIELQTGKLFYQVNEVSKILNSK